MRPTNPFYVLEIGTAATPGEIERQGRKVLGMLEVGAARGAKYECTLGTFSRDATLVREAIAALRDPKRRAKEAYLAELAQLDDEHRAVAARLGHAAQPDAPVADAFPAFGLRGL